MNRLAEFRKLRGISQLNLSRMVNISPSDLSRIENNKLVPFPGWKRRLARALKGKVSEIFPDEQSR